MAKHKRLGNGKGRPKSKTTPYRTDRGTEQFQEKRMLLAGPKGNPDKCFDAINVLHQRREITKAQFDAGVRYAKLYRLTIGSAEPHTSMREPGNDNGDGLDRRTRETEAAFDEARSLLLAMGRKSFDAVQNVAVFDRLPRWALTHDWRPSDRRDRDALMDGLTALCPRQARAA